MKHKRSIKNVPKSNEASSTLKTIEENAFLIKYKKELEFDDDSPNYAEKLSTDNKKDNLTQK